MRTQPEPFILTLPSGQTMQISWRTHKRARHLKITADHDGFRVTSPPRAPRVIVEKFVQSQQAWIAAQHNKYQATKPAQNTLLYLGDEYQLQLVESAHPRVIVEPDSKKIFLRPIVRTASSARTALERWLQSEAARVVAPLTQELSSHMNVSVETLQFKQTKSRWGSCSSQGALSFNWRLIHAPENVVRYVVIHELAHRTHMNHSSKFWQLVEQHDPDYRVHRGWLKRHAHRCITPEIEA